MIRRSTEFYRRKESHQRDLILLNKMKADRLVNLQRAKEARYALRIKESIRLNQMTR